MSKEVHTTTPQCKIPPGRKQGAYFKGKTETCNRGSKESAPHTDTKAEAAAEGE